VDVQVASGASGEVKSEDAAPSNRSGFIRPTSGPTTSPFDPNRVHPIHGDVRPHNGIDFGQAGEADKVIRAAADGVVAYTGTMSGYGNTVMVTHNINGQEYTTLYAHLDSFKVSNGETVSQGDQIAVMGNTGGSTGVHLHFEIHPGGYKNPVDPAGYLN